ncbi:MAG: hypothetical protein ACOYM2_16190, partial [Rectinemataceae bacterium]
MEKNETKVLLAKEILEGLIIIGDRIGTRFFPVMDYSGELFEGTEKSLKLGADWTRLLTTQLSPEIVKTGSRNILKADTGMAVDVVIGLAACRKDKSLINVIVKRFLAERLDQDQKTHLLSLFVTTGVKLDRQVFEAAMASEDDRAGNGFMSALLACIEDNPELIDDDALFALAQEESAQRVSIAHPRILSRLARAGKDVLPIVRKVLEERQIRLAFASELSATALELEHRGLAEILINDSNTIDCFTSQTIRKGGGGFAIDLIEKALTNGGDNGNAPYLLPLLASIKRGNGDWLEPYLKDEQDWRMRLGAAYACAWYPSLKPRLRMLEKDEDNDVTIAALAIEMVLNVHARKESGFDWEATSGTALENRFGRIILPAIAIHLQLPMTEAIRSFELLASPRLDLKAAKAFFKDRIHRLIHYLDKSDMSCIDLSSIPDDGPDFRGRASLILAAMGGDKARQFLDQYLADTDNEASAAWAVVLLGACGGPLSALASLRWRIIQSRCDRRAFRSAPKDLGLLAALTGTNGFFYDAVVAHFSKKLALKYPDLLGYWLRQRESSEADDHLLDALTEAHGDSFLKDVLKLRAENGKVEKLGFPERQIYNNIGREKSVRNALLGKLVTADIEHWKKISLLSHAVAVDGGERSFAEAYHGLRALEKNPTKVFPIYKLLLRDCSFHPPLALVRAIASNEDDETLRFLADMWD